MDNKKIFEARELIFKEGDQASRLFIVTSGEILLLKLSKDRLIPVFRAQSGDIIGENAMIAEAEYQSSAISLSRAELIEIPSFNFKRVYSESPKWLQDLTITMVNRYQMTSSLIADNKVFSENILTENEFTPQLESEFKKLINQ